MSIPSPHRRAAVRFVGVVALAASVGACMSPGTPRVQSGPNSIEAIRRSLQGRWSLVTFDVFPPGQPAMQIKGGGTLVYDDFGNLDMQVGLADRTLSADFEKAGIPLKDGTLSSRGRVALDAQNRTLTFILEGQRPLVDANATGPLAFDRPRHWELQGNTLTLTTRGDDGKPLSVSRWRRAP